MKLKIKKINIYDNICIYFALIVVVLSHYLKNIYKVGGEGITFYAGYIAWLVMFGYFFILKNRLTVNKKLIYITLILLINEIIGVLLGENNGFSVLSEIHQALFFIIAIWVAYGNDKQDDGKALTIEQIDKIMRLIVILGVFASLYAMIWQNDSVVNVLKGVSVSIYSWKYKSFFGQRNIFAALCYFCSIASTYMFIRKNKIVYVIITGIFFGQIYITNSRAALFSFIMFIIIYVYYNTKDRKILIWGAIVIVGLLIIMNINEIYGLLGKYSHVNSNGEESFSTRLKMWKLGISELIKNNCMVTGFGFGASNIFLKSIYNWGSFHNVYVEILFDMGIIGLLIYTYMIFISIKSICNINNKKFRNVILAGFLSYLFYSLFESGAMLFSVKFHSILVTIMFIIIPRYYKDI
jgi:O-antigen ligase